MTARNESLSIPVSAGDELFDLEADPEERAPIRRRSSKASAALEEYLFEYLESTAKRY